MNLFPNDLDFSGSWKKETCLQLVDLKKQLSAMMKHYFVFCELYKSQVPFWYQNAATASLVDKCTQILLKLFWFSLSLSDIFLKTTGLIYYSFHGIFDILISRVLSFSKNMDHNYCWCNLPMSYHIFEKKIKWLPLPYTHNKNLHCRTLLLVIKHRAR